MLTQNTRYILMKDKYDEIGFTPFAACSKNAAKR